ncbi:MAG TPA: tRNA (adenosine(37)-N6)-threonylcarbamoyltransferase complex transferase subunit TsaD, partial [Patescibacteria group bacterium]|nr:tRNA (adenosine(37)-N6)-threonylcarbamoyltransferase complex transferase subunit TsaD [Patescibacteria group bacterium]
ETSASIVSSGNELKSLVVASSSDFHVLYGGIVPEIASRKQLELIIPVVDESLKKAKLKMSDISAIAVTEGPGLAGSLLIGVLTARNLALSFNKPLYAVNHVSAHIYANFITKSHDKSVKPLKNSPSFPFLGVIISGGHCQTVLFENHIKYKVIGRTLDDAIGEAFDKVAKILGLPYPGGPNISKCALNGKNIYDFPLAIVNRYDFSFSGLKTAVLRKAQSLIGKDYNFPSYKLAKALSEAQKANLAASFEATAIKSLIIQINNAAKDYQVNKIVLAGGVAANNKIRQTLLSLKDFEVYMPDINLCTDNAAFVASMAGYKIKNKISKSDPLTLDIKPNLKM